MKSISKSFPGSFKGAVLLQVNAITPQVINAGKIRLHNDSDSASQHFDNLRREYTDVLNKLRSHVDDAIDTGDFIRASEQAMRRYTVYCENAIRTNEPQQMVDNTSQIARFGNRVLMTAKNEADNSEEPSFVHKVNNAAQQLHSGLLISFLENSDYLSSVWVIFE